MHLGHEVDGFHLVPRLRMSDAIPLLPVYALIAWTGTALPFYTFTTIFVLKTYKYILKFK